jgi:hypothetical protein
MCTEVIPRLYTENHNIPYYMSYEQVENALGKMCAHIKQEQYPFIVFDAHCAIGMNSTNKN